jgi:acyl dehydratase
VIAEKLAELDAAVRASLLDHDSSGSTGESVEDAAAPGHTEADNYRWSVIAGWCSIGCLLPLKDPLEPLLSTQGIGVLHAEQSFEYKRIPAVDQELRASAEITKSRQFRDSYIVQVAENLQTADGEPVLTGSSTLVVAPQKALSESRRSPSPSLEAASAGDGPEVVASATGCANLSELVRYAGASGDFNPIHWDAAYARSFGFEHPIVHGMLIYHWAIWTLYEQFGKERPFAARIKFVSPLYAGESASLRIFKDLSFETFLDAESQPILVAKGLFTTGG